MRWFRQTDSRYPFLWESSAQPEMRWHGAGEGPAHYLASTPAGAWAEFIRHEHLTEPDDLVGVRRALWAVDVDHRDVADAVAVTVPRRTATGPETTYPACQADARALRLTGHAAVIAPSAALATGAARASHTDGGLRAGPDVDGEVLVLFGLRPDLHGWLVVAGGDLDPTLLGMTRPLRAH